MKDFAVLKKNSKKAMSPQALVMMISLLVTAVIFLIILFPQWKSTAEKSTDSSTECSTDLLLRSIVKKVSFGYGDVPIKCELKRVTVDEKTIEKWQPLAKQATKYYSQQNSEIQNIYPDDVLGQRKWALSKIVADELVNCHKKGWEGKLNIQQTGLLELYPEQGNLCLYCARIEYNEKVRDMNMQIDLYPWLENNLVGQRTYYDYLSASLFSIDELEAAKIHGPKFLAMSLMNAVPILQLNPLVRYVASDEKLAQSLALRAYISEPTVDTRQSTAVMLVLFKDGGAFATAQPLKELVRKDMPVIGQICGKVIGEV